METNENERELKQFFFKEMHETYVLALVESAAVSGSPCGKGDIAVAAESG